MGVISDPAVSNGDLARRVAELERQVTALTTVRRLPNAAIGSGGLRIHSGGGIVVEGSDGQGDVFRVGSDPVELFLRPELIAKLSRQIFASGIHTDFVATEESLGDTSFSWVSLTGGPSIANIEVEAGTMIIHVDARVRTGVFDLGESTGELSPEITGATTVAAGTLDRKEHGLLRGTNNFQTDVNARNTTTFIATGLNSGFHNIEVKYRAFVSDGGNDVRIAQRGLAVLAF